MIQIEYNNTHILEEPITLETKRNIPNMTKVCAIYEPRDTNIWFSIFPRHWKYNFFDPFGMLMQDMFPSLIESLETLLLNKKHSYYEWISGEKVLTPTETNKFSYISLINESIYVYIYMRIEDNKLLIYTRSSDFDKRNGFQINEHDIAEEIEVVMKSQIEVFVTFLNTYLKDLHDDVPKIRKEVSDYIAYMQRVKKINEAACNMGIPVNDSYLD